MRVQPFQEIRVASTGSDMGKGFHRILWLRPDKCITMFFDLATGGINRFFPDTLLDLVRVTSPCCCEDARTQSLYLFMVGARLLLSCFARCFSLSLLLCGLRGLRFAPPFSIYIP